MAVPIAKAFVDVELNQRAFMSGLAGSQAAFTKTTGAMQARAAATSAAITKSFVAATAGLALLGGVVIMGVKAAAKYETAWREVWTLMSITEDQMKSLADATSRMSVSFGEAETSGLKALYQITSAGFLGADAMMILQESLKGAVGGVSDVFTAADILTGALNAWNIAAGRSAYVMDLIFTTIKEGKVTMDSLAAGAGRVMAIAGPFGIAMEEAFGALAALTKPLGGVHLAATALVASIRAFIKPQEELNALMEEFGYATGRALVEEKGLAGAIVFVKEAAEAASIPLETLFSNVRAMMGVMPLATTMSEEYARILDSMYDSAESAGAAVEKMMQTFEMQWSIFSKTLGRAKRLFGEAFLPIFTSGLETMIPYVEILAEYFRQSGDAVRYFVMHGLKMLGVIVVVAGLAKAFLLLMRPIGLLIAAAALLYGAWYFNLWGIREMAEQLGETLTKVVVAPLKFVLEIAGAEGAATSLETFMGSLNQSLVGAAAAVGGFVLGAFLIKGLLGKLAGAVLVGNILTLPTLAILATLAWDIFNTIGKIREGAGWPSAVDLATRVVGMITGAIAGAVVGGLPGAVIGAATGYAFAVGVQALVEITWDIVDKFGKAIPAWVKEGLFGPATGFPFEYEKYQRGGLIPGVGLGDRIPALLEPGEFVVPRWMMETPWIASLIGGIWSGAARFQAGGDVGAGRGAAPVALMTPGAFQAYIESLTQALPPAVKAIMDYITVHGQARENVAEFAEMLGLLLKPLDEIETGFTDLLAEVEAAIQAEMDKAEALAGVTTELDSFADRLAEIQLAMVATAIPSLLSDMSAGLMAVLAGGKWGELAALLGEMGAMDTALGAMRDQLERIITGDFGEMIKIQAQAVLEGLGDLTTGLGLTFKELEEQRREAAEAAKRAAEMWESEFQALVTELLQDTAEMMARAAYSMNEWRGYLEEMGGPMAEYYDLILGLQTALKEELRYYEALVPALETQGLATEMAAERLERLQAILGIVGEEGETFADQLRKWSGVVVKAAEMVFGPEVGQGVSIALTGIIAAISGDIAGVVMAALNAVEYASDLMRQKAEEAAESIRTGFATVADAANTVSGAFFDLARQSDAFRRLQEGFRSVWARLMDSLFGVLWPFAAILENVAKAFEMETKVIEASTKARVEEFEAIGIPAGFKGARYEWRAAMPGVPYRPWEEEVPVPPAPPELPEFPMWVIQNIEALGDVIIPLITIIDKFQITMAKAWSSIIPSLVKGILPVINTFGWLTDQLSGWIEGVLAPDLARFAEGFGTFWETMVDPFVREEFGPTVAGWLNRVYGWLDDIIGFFAGPVWTWITGPFWKMLKPHVSTILGMFEDFGKWVSANWSTISAFLTDLADIWLKSIETSLGDFLDNIIAFVTGSKGMGDEISDLGWALGLLTGALKFAREAADFIGDTFTVVAFLVALPFNVIIAFANAVIGLVNLIPGVKIPRIPSIEIPLPMQAGGIVTGPTWTMLGEAGPEAVIPLDGFRGLDNIFGGLQTSDITLNVTVKSTLIADGREFAASVGRQKVKQEIIRGRY